MSACGNKHCPQFVVATWNEIAMSLLLISLLQKFRKESYNTFVAITAIFGCISLCYSFLYLTAKVLPAMRPLMTDSYKVDCTCEEIHAPLASDVNFVFYACSAVISETQFIDHGDLYVRTKRNTSSLEAIIGWKIGGNICMKSDIPFHI